MKAVILGANSYIARNMIALNARSHFAEAVLCDYQPEHADNAVGYRQINPSRPSDLEEAIAGCELIYFFIGKTGTLNGFDEAGLFTDVNEKYLLNLLNAYRKTESSAKIIFPSTRLVYRGSKRPLRESAAKMFLTPYAIQKYSCEQYLEMYSRLFHIKYCILRIGVPYGTLIPSVSSYGTLDFFMKQARDKGSISIYGRGNQRRTFTYIEDLCHSLWLAGLNDTCINDVYNVGGEEYSIGRLAEIIAERTSAKVLHQPWPEQARKIESGDTVFDSAKLDALIGNTLSMTVTRWTEEILPMMDGSISAKRERERET